MAARDFVEGTRIKKPGKLTLKEKAIENVSNKARRFVKANPKFFERTLPEAKSNNLTAAVRNNWKKGVGALGAAGLAAGAYALHKKRQQQPQT